MGLSVIQHAEDTRMTGGCSMNAGPTAFRLGLRGMPPEAEYGLVERDIRLVTELSMNGKGDKNGNRPICMWRILQRPRRLRRCARRGAMGCA